MPEYPVPEFYLSYAVCTDLVLNFLIRILYYYHNKSNFLITTHPPQHAQNYQLLIARDW